MVPVKQKLHLTHNAAEWVEEQRRRAEADKLAAITHQK